MVRVGPLQGVRVGPDQTVLTRTGQSHVEQHDRDAVPGAICYRERVQVVSILADGRAEGKYLPGALELFAQGQDQPQIVAEPLRAAVRASGLRYWDSSVRRPGFAVRFQACLL